MKNKNKILIYLFGGFGLMASWLFVFAFDVSASQYQFTPTSQNLVTGTDKQATSATAAATTGVNAGSWRGTLADDNLHWSVTGTTSGLNAQLNVDNVILSGANKMVVQTAVDTDAALNVKFQICDWISSSGVDNAADAQCTGGGWRSLNSQNASNVDIDFTTTSAADISLQWHLYDGYFTTGTTGGTAVSTPLSNFVKADATKRVKIRYFSAVNSVTDLDIDFLRVGVMIDSIYFPAGLTNLGTGTAAGTYASASPVGNTASAQITTTAGDAIYATVGGTAGSPGDFYLSFKNVKTLSGMNAILVRADYSCSAATGNIIPQIRNFTTSTWENLSSGTIACSTTDAVNGWAKNNIAMSDYISSGESRVRFVASANGTHTLRIDSAYLMVGSVNADSAQCEITLGSGTLGNCVNTRSLDMTATAGVFNNNAEDLTVSMGTGESNSMYALDAPQSAAAAVEGTSSNISVPMTLSADTQVVGVHYASRFSSGGSGSPTLTVQAGIKDYSGLNAATGGWTQVGATSNSATQVYTDSLTALAVTAYGLQANPEDYIDTVNDVMNSRLRTTVNGINTTNAITGWDFNMLSLQWLESSDTISARYQFIPTGHSLITGTEFNADASTAASTEGTNMGSWRGTLSDDNLHWIAGITSSGIDMQLNTNGVQLNGANKMLINTEIDLDATTPALKVQICDWVSSSSVDNAADAQCTGGGWRSLNSQNASNVDVNFTSATATALQWHIYDGYFTTGTTGGTAISTPLSNFVKSDASKQVKIRYFSTTNTTSSVAIDYLRITPVIDSIYAPSGVSVISGGTPVGSYINAGITGNTATAQVLTSDDIRLAVPGTAGSIADFYYTYKNVRTYTGMNTIYVRAEYSCSTTGINHRPKIYNFNTSSWEDLGSGAIACSATDAVNMFAKNNVTVSNYINGSNEIRIGWYGSANSTVQIRHDAVYVMLGTTNSDTALCEVTMGTGTAANCASTRNVDERNQTTADDFLNTAEATSTTMGTGEANSIYGFDSTNAASVAVNASNISMSVVQPSSSTITGIHFAAKVYPGPNSTNPDLLVQAGLKDESGLNQVSGGWTQVGAVTTIGAVLQTDSITALAASAYGLLSNPEDYLDSNSGLVNMRMRTTTAGNTGVTHDTQWDFAMVSISWIVPQEVSVTYTFSGNLYDSDDSTSLTSYSGSVKMSVGGTTSYAATASGGTFSIEASAAPINGDVITVWFDSSGGVQGALIFKYGASCSGSPNCTGLRLAKDHLYFDNNHTGNITNADLAGCDSDSGAVCSDADLLFSSNAGVLTTTFANGIKITSGKTFAPGGDVTTARILGGSYVGGSETLTLNGSSLSMFTSSFTPNSNTVVYTGAGAATIPSLTYNNLQIKPSSNSVTHSIGGGVLTVNGNLEIGNGTNTSVVVTGIVGDPLINILGNLTINNGTAASLNYLSSTDIDGNVTINAGGSLYKNSTSINIGGNFSNSGTVDLTGSTTIFDATDAGNTITGTTTCGVFGSINFNGSGGEWTKANGVLCSQGTFAVTAGTLNSAGITSSGNMSGGGAISDTGTVTLGSNANISNTSNNWLFNNLTIGNGGSGTHSLSGAGELTISGTLNNTASHTLNLGSKVLNLTSASQPIIDAGAWNSQTSTIKHSGTAVPVINENIVYYNLHLLPSTNLTSQALSFLLSVNNDLIIGNGTNTFTLDASVANFGFTVKNITISSAATFIAPGAAISLLGNFTNNGTFDSNLGQIYAASNTGSLSILGSSNTTFGTLIVSAPTVNLKFAAGRTYTFVDYFEISGGDENLYLESTVPGSQWFVSLPPVTNFGTVYIKDSGCSGGSTLSGQYSLFDNGNNGPCWGLISRGGGAGNSNAPVGGGGSGGGGGTSGGGSGGGGGSSGGGAGGGIEIVENVASVFTKTFEIAGTEWSNLTNTTASDDAVAEATIPFEGFSDTIAFTGFNFAIPTNAIIKGISLLLEVDSANGGINLNFISLLKNNVEHGNNKATGQIAPFNLTLGSGTDLWGGTWTASDINNSLFGASLNMNNFNIGDQIAKIDFLKIIVNYVMSESTGGGGSGGGGGAAP